MTIKNPLVDEYFKTHTNWLDIKIKLRKILLTSELTEEYKWKQPCYSFDNKNLFIIGGFKDYCALSFFKGVLLNDPKKILIQQGQNTQSARILKFTTTKQVDDLEKQIKVWINESIELSKQGIKAEFKKPDELEIPIELQVIFDQEPEFKEAFFKLTPGRQRGYILFFTGAKQSKTVTARIEKNIDRILDGYGFHDCTCGLTKKKPNCDGSHKQLK